MGSRRWYRRSPALRRWLRRRKAAGVYWLVRTALWLPRQVSLPRALAIADRLGNAAYLLLGSTRRLALEHIGLALGDTLSPAERVQTVRASFRNLARCFVEIAHFDTIRDQIDTYVDTEGWQHMEEALARGRGTIAITGHIGNWELLAAYCALHGIPVGAIARRMRDPRLDALIVDFRAKSGVETILRESPGSSRHILKILNNNGFLALLIDQDTRAPSLSVPFFGRPARTPAAAAVLALRRDLPVVALFMQRRPEGGHRLTVLPPIELPHSGDRRRDTLALTRRFNEIFEERVRQNPAEWVWWHRRWRRGPISRLDLDHEIQYSEADSF